MEALYEALKVPMVTYGADTWGTKQASVQGITFSTQELQRDRERLSGKSSGQSKICVKKKLSDKVNRKLLKWFERVERVREKRLTKRVYQLDVKK